jgi:hypothetical protein
MARRPSSIAGKTVRFSLGWRRVLAAWAVVLIVILAGFAALELAPSFGLAKISPALHGARIPQGVRTPQNDPFDVGPPAFGDDAGAWDAD